MTSSPTAPPLPWLAELFKALSDPTRLKLIKLLEKQPTVDCSGECNGRGFLCVNALARRLGVSQSAVSQHLRILRQAGLVRGDRHGSFVHCSLDEDGLAQYRAALQEALGYACFGSHPLTEGTYDLYWIAVHPVAQGRGVGHTLLGGVEAEVRSRGGRLLLIETSDGPAYRSARRLYETSGYRCEATVHDFYSPGDSLLIYAKDFRVGSAQREVVDVPRILVPGDDMSWNRIGVCRH